MLSALKNLIEITVNGIVTRDVEAVQNGIPKVIDLCIKVFPQIIVTYSDHRMKDISEEAMFWPSQLERLISITDNDDIFAVYDILYNETYRAILEYEEILKSKSIDLSM